MSQKYSLDKALNGLRYSDSGVKMCLKYRCGFMASEKKTPVASLLSLLLSRRKVQLSRHITDYLSIILHMSRGAILSNKYNHVNHV